MKKVFPTWVVESRDENLLQDFNRIRELAILMTEDDQKDEFSKINKQFCDKIREDFEMTGIIGFLRDKVDKDILYVVEYEDVPATEDNHYQQLMDEETNRPYILVEELKPALLM